jgi:uncharacterized protein (DUF1501 family)
MHIQTDACGILSRRTFLRSVTVGAAGLGMFGWKETVALQAEELRRRGTACILLFMRGGPSQLETFDPKPGTTNGGPTTAVDTAVPGVQIAAGWDNVAKSMKDIALIRSITNKEGEHQRATYQLHTGYVPMGATKYPTLGSIVAAELGPQEFDLPNFVSIGNRATTIGAGFLGMNFAPFVVGNATQPPTNLTLPQRVNEKRFGKRMGLLDQLEEDFAESGGGPRVDDHKAVYGKAAKIVRSPRLKAFDLNQEKDTLRDGYGRTPFGQGCLLARRLIEQGVTFVEVESNGWDTHDNNFERVKSLSGQVDPAFATLLRDLKERGMLDKTLVIWMGEFGRTPRINPRTGRDHFPRAFNVALAGAGIKGGQVIGATNSDGTEVASRPVSVPDLFCSFYKALAINARKENAGPLGRPIKIMDKGEAVKELFV